MTAAVFFAACGVVALFLLWLTEFHDLPAILWVATLVLSVASVCLAVNE